MHFKEYTLKNRKLINPDLGLLEFEEGMPSCEPGQFVSVWIPSLEKEKPGEKPLAPAIVDPQKGLCLAVRNVGTHWKVCSVGTQF